MTRFSRQSRKSAAALGLPPFGRAVPDMLRQPKSYSGRFRSSKVPQLEPFEFARGKSYCGTDSEEQDPSESESCRARDHMTRGAQILPLLQR